MLSKIIAPCFCVAIKADLLGEKKMLALWVFSCEVNISCCIQLYCDTVFVWAATQANMNIFMFSSECSFCRAGQLAHSKTQPGCVCCRWWPSARLILSVIWIYDICSSLENMCHFSEYGGQIWSQLSSKLHFRVSLYPNHWESGADEKLQLGKKLI